MMTPMKRFALISLAALCPLPAVFAQTITGAPGYQLPVTVVSQKWYGSGAPTAALNYPVQPGDWYFDTTTPAVYYCSAPVTATIGINGGPAACTSVTSGQWVIILGSTGTSTGTGAVVRATSPTIAGPILASPVVTGPAPVACGATCSATSGQLIVCATAAGCAMSLPTAAGTGNVIRERITVATTSGAEKVLLTTTTNTIIGTAIVENAAAASVFVGNAGTYHSIQMPYAGTQPSGGFIGDTITCTDIAATIWACDVVSEAGTAAVTPYSTATT